MSPLRLLSIAGLLFGILALGLALVWNDVLPGAWRLQGWVLGVEGRENRTRLQHAAERQRLFQAEQHQAPPGAVLFLGSSTIERYPFEAAFPNKPCVGRGINGDSVRELIDRLDISLPSTSPAALIVAIGGNDLRRLKSPAEAVGHVATRLMDELQRRFPDVPITWLGLFGATETSPEELWDLERYNEILQEATSRRGITFVATHRAPLVDANGCLVRTFAADRYHLNREGYIQLSRWIVEEGGDAGALLQP